jgi:hypothetical protein
MALGCLTRGEDGGSMLLLDRLTGWFRGRPTSGPAAPSAIIAGTPPIDSALVQQVAERLRQRDLAAGGWAAEAGALPLESYLPEAHRLVRGIALGDIEAGPPAP